ncbi:hypothetical protein [Curtobacterium flaccumfaciens]|uniref:hypothetical protein n=1 Tax=Curtobacterium flaccumfaciens TaxID=2035 RepID=UPI0039A297C5
MAELLLEHGLAINMLTASDTGWDLHCHVPEGLFLRSSTAGHASWSLSGRTTHVQVKSAPTDRLSVGTVRGWVSGTASGVPTFLFGRLNGNAVFSSPADLAHWLHSGQTPGDDAAKHKYTFRGKETRLQTPLATHPYSVERFPSVLQLWVRYPQLALHFPAATAWMNHEAGAGDLYNVVMPELANAIWADAGFGRHTETSELEVSLVELYRAAGSDDAEGDALELLKSGLAEERLLGDALFTRDTVYGVASLVDNHNPRGSVLRLLNDLAYLHSTDARVPQ